MTAACIDFDYEELLHRSIGNLEALPMAGARRSLGMHHSKDPNSLFWDYDSRWLISENEIENDDPAAYILLNQEKLRDNSLSRVQKLEKSDAIDEIKINNVNTVNDVQEIEESLSLLDEILHNINEDTFLLPSTNRVSFLSTSKSNLPFISLSLESALNEFAKSPITLSSELVAPLGVIVSPALSVLQIVQFDISSNAAQVDILTTDENDVRDEAEGSAKYPKTNAKESLIQEKNKFLSLQEIVADKDDDENLLRALENENESYLPIDASVSDSSTSNNLTPPLLPNIGSTILAKAASFHFMTEECEINIDTDTPPSKSLTINRVEKKGAGSPENLLTLPPPPPDSAITMATATDTKTLEEEDLDNLLTSSLTSLLPVATSAKKTTSVPSNIAWAVRSSLPESEFEALRPKLAMQFPFELDFFQKQAVMRLERRETIFVAAHTSAGKTVVAEYAIAMARKHMTRAIYTSPIKALSNQKYRDFKDKFDDVGLITGDISVNPDASCLIMTTEILRSMLYRGADTVRDIEWVIFDEVHYVNDAERGVVWEEVIIMLPDRIRMIFLSATTPNTMEFSDWIGRTKRTKVYVISTDKRPIPLQHFLLHDDEVYPLLTPETGYNATAIAAATNRQKDKLKPKPVSAENAKAADQRQKEKAAMLAQKTGGRGVLSGGRGGSSKPPSASQPTVQPGSIAGGRSQWLSLLRLLRAGGREEAGGLKAVDFKVGLSGRVLSSAARKEKERLGYEKYEKLPADFRAKVSKKEYENMHIRGDEDEVEGEDSGLLPAVIFCFSKKKCEEIADFLVKEDLLTRREKGEVMGTMTQVTKRLNPLDARLPQVLHVADMLSRGIGVHHGGLLPLLKECVELLFSKSLVKILFATETFAMGVNMPARSVVFNGFRKHDGRSFRDLLPGEYTQMAGRAGRRGKDKVGTVIVAAWTDLPAEAAVKTLLTGAATGLSSKFRLSYSMILNLLRANDLSVEEMIKRSFSEFHAQKNLAGKDLLQLLHRFESAGKILADRIASAASSAGEDTLGKAEMEQYYRLTQQCQQIQNEQLQFLLGQMAHQKDCSAVSWALRSGRIIFAYSTHLPHPSFAVVLSEPESSLNDNSKKASDIPTSSAKSDVSASTSLTTSGSGSGSIDHLKELRASSSTVNKGIQKIQMSDTSSKSKSIKDLFVWALVLLPSAAPPSTDCACDGTEPAGNATSGNGYLVTKLSLSDILVVTGAIMADALPLAALASSLRLSLPLVLHEETALPLMQFVKASEQSLAALATGTAVPGGSGSVKSLVWDACKELQIPGLTFLTSQVRLTNTFRNALTNQCRDSSKLSEQYTAMNNLARINNKILSLKHLVSNENLSLFPDFQQRLSVLQTLGYVSQDRQTVTLKGRVACEMSTADELIATEMMFRNVLEPLNPPEAAAILSALVFQEKSDDTGLTSRMETARTQLQSIAGSLESLQEQLGVATQGADSNSLGSGKLNFGLAGVVYEWARGTPFSQITELTLSPEGSIVRCITRLDELLKDVRNAARVIGNPSLYRKMEAASQCIKRDIVFAASLYI